MSGLKRGWPVLDGSRLRIAPYLHGDGRYYPDNIYLDPDQTEWTLRLPQGLYNVFGLISTMDASGRWIDSSRGSSSTTPQRLNSLAMKPPKACPHVAPGR